MLTRIGPMSGSKPRTLFRIVGLFVWLTVLIETLAVEMPMPPNLPSLVGIVVDVVFVVIFILFGLAFWFSTRAPETLSRHARAFLLGLQIVLAVPTNTSLLSLVAAEIPFVMPGRAAFLWMGSQIVLTILGAFWSAGTPGFVTMPGLSHLPYTWVAIFTVISVLAFQIFCFSGGYIAAAEERRRRELARVNAELRATQGLLADSSRMAERLLISRELHDTLGHHLTVLSVNLELAQRLADNKAAEPVREAHGVARLLLAEVREVVGSLREARSVDLRRAIETLLAGTPEPRVHLDFPEDLEIADPVSAHVLFRCVQEAVTNAVRHSRARNLWIELAREDGGVVLLARDDGRGSAAVQPGNGLRGMRERLEESGGSLEIESGPGEGFRLRCWIPALEASA